MAKCRCRMPDGIDIKPNGINSLDPCAYVLKEIHRNVTVEITQCVNCGHVSVGWFPQENTEDEYFDELEEGPEEEMGEPMLQYRIDKEMGDETDDET